MGMATIMAALAGRPNHKPKGRYCTRSAATETKAAQVAWMRLEGKNGIKKRNLMRDDQKRRPQHARFSQWLSCRASQARTRCKSRGKLNEEKTWQLSWNLSPQEYQKPNATKKNLDEKPVQYLYLAPHPHKSTQPLSPLAVSVMPQSPLTAGTVAHRPLAGATIASATPSGRLLMCYTALIQCLTPPKAQNSVAATSKLEVTWECLGPRILRLPVLSSDYSAARKNLVMQLGIILFQISSCTIHMCFIIGANLFGCLS